MRNFNKIKPLHFGTSKNEVPMYEEGTASGGITPMVNLYFDKNTGKYYKNGLEITKEEYESSMSNACPITDGDSSDNLHSTPSYDTFTKSQLKAMGTADASTDVADLTDASVVGRVGISPLKVNQGEGTAEKVAAMQSQHGGNDGTRGSVADPGATPSGSGLGALAGDAGGTPKPGVAKAANAAARVAGALSGFGKEPKDPDTQNLNKVADGMADAALSSGNPYAMAAGAAVKVGAALNKMTGNGGVDGHTAVDKFAGSTFGFVLGAMNPDPIALTLYWTNRLGAQSTDKFVVDQDIKADLGDAYVSSYKDLDKAASGAGKYGLFSRGAMHIALNRIEQAKHDEGVLRGIRDEAKDANTASEYEGLSLRNEMKLNGGYKSLRAGKKGMKVNSFDFASKVVKASLGLQFTNAYKAPETDNNQRIALSAISNKIDPYSGLLSQFTSKVDELNTTEKIIQYMKSNGLNPDLFNLEDFLNSDDLESYLNAERRLEGSGNIPMKYANASHPFFTGTYNGYLGGAYNTEGTTFTPTILNFANMSPSAYRTLGEQQGLNIDYSAITGKEGFADNWTLEDIFDDSKFNNEIMPFLMGLPTAQLIALRRAQELADAEIAYQNYLQLELLRQLQELKNNGHAYISEILKSNLDILQNPELFEYTLTLLGLDPEEVRSWGYEWNHLTPSSYVGMITYEGRPIVGDVLTTPTFKEGGTLETQYLKEGGSFNVIPDGALHKNKHHMEDAEGLTKKGIPVVTEEGGELVLQAEIEINEIIFRLEVTEKLEKLAKEGTEEAAIEAGKLLVLEILHNTHDNTGLIKDTK